MILTHEEIERKNNTQIICEEKENWEYNAPHSFLYVQEDEKDPSIVEVISEVKFQKGPVLEVGLNGVQDVDLLLMVQTRLQAFQKTEYACKENVEAIASIQDAIVWMTARTKSREARNVEGTSMV
ncbi:hypothetical protein [Romboutsia ilealis]|uniref:hypothetical protein n=1 Tax=Romboutsia ilealis TaxID=1115758 RepID=UPI00272D5F0A|nr:hypothetical protein [Romboutsia ilealis]